MHASSAGEVHAALRLSRIDEVLLDALKSVYSGFARSSSTLIIRLLNTIKTNKRIRIFQHNSYAQIFAIQVASLIWL